MSEGSSGFSVSQGLITKWVINMVADWPFGKYQNFKQSRLNVAKNVCLQSATVYSFRVTEQNE